MNSLRRRNAETSWSSLSSGHSAKSTSTSADDPFVFLEQSSSQAYSSSGLFSEPLKKDAGKSSVFSSFDELEGFAMGKVQNKANEQSNYFQKERAESATQDLDSIFGMGSKPSSGSMHKAKTVVRIENYISAVIFLRTEELVKFAVFKASDLCHL